MPLSGPRWIESDGLVSPDIPYPTARSEDTSNTRSRRTYLHVIGRKKSCKPSLLLSVTLTFALDPEICVRIVQCTARVGQKIRGISTSPFRALRTRRCRCCTAIERTVSGNNCNSMNVDTASCARRSIGDRLIEGRPGIPGHLANRLERELV